MRNLGRLIAGALALASVDGAQARGEVVPVPGRPAGNPDEWVTTKDYPIEAIRAGAAGTTGFMLNYDRTGAVTDCAVTSSSGSASLDEATCSVMLRRARFDVGRDSRGEAVGGTFSSHLRWVLPRIALPSGAWVFKVAQDFNKAGVAEANSCRVVEVVGAPMPPATDALCSHIVRTQSPHVYLGPDGKPTAYTMVTTHSVQFEPRPGISPASAQLTNPQPNPTSRP